MYNLSSYPNMIPEIIEAIHLMYEDDPSEEADCLICLANLRGNIGLSRKFAEFAELKLEEIGRCPCCGSIMQINHYKELHSELDGCPTENLYELYCPNCDFRGDNI